MQEQSFYITLLKWMHLTINFRQRKTPEPTPGGGLTKLSFSSWCASLRKSRPFETPHPPLLRIKWGERLYST